MAGNEQILRDFRRAFYRARDAFAPFSRGGGVGFRIDWTDGELSSEVTGPTDEEVTRFLVAMRRFLVQSDPLHLDALSRLCREVAPTQFDASTSVLVEEHLAKLRRGDIRLTVNHTEYAAADIYQKFSDGGLFNDDADAERFIHGLLEVPGAGAIVRFTFVNFVARAYQLVEFLFARLHDGGCFDRAKLPNTGACCIYCLSNDGEFTSEEHVFPEALGNDEIVLPAGLVCDRCNNGVLARLDRALVSFPPIAFLMVQFVPHAKDGRLPSANFQNLKIEKTAPRHLRFTAKDKTGNIREVEELADGHVRFEVDINGGRFEPRLLGRALFKVGLGLLALEEGPAIVRSARFDAARRFVTSDVGFENNLVLRTVGVPRPTVSAMRYPSLPGTTFAFDVFGLVMMVNLETMPILDVPPVMTANKFIAHSLAQRRRAPQAKRHGRRASSRG